MTEDTRSMWTYSTTESVEKLLPRNTCVLIKSLVGALGIELLAKE